MSYLVAGIFLEDGVDAINELRDAYDPTARLIEPHIPVLHPVPDTLGTGDVLDHLAEVLARWAPFQIRLGGFHRTEDHWLFLTLAEGAEKVAALSHDVYSGPLSGFRRTGVGAVPHVGLGLFVRRGSAYSMFDPDASSFDEAGFEAALHRARLLDFGGPRLATELRVVTIPEIVMEWASGQRPTLPRALRVAEVARLPL